MQAIERVFAILRSLGASQGRGTVGQVAESTGLPKSTVSRMLAALEAEGVVERVGDGEYAIGLGLTSLTGQVDSQAALAQVAEPYLRALATDYGEGAGLSVEDGNRSLYAVHVGSEGPVRTEDWTGQSFPYHTVAGGLAILATWPDRRINQYAAAGLDRFTGQTVTSRAALRRRVREIRRTGYAVTIGDFADEINGVGAAIRRPGGTAVGAVNVYGPAFRFPGERNLSDIGPHLIEVAAEIGERLAV